MAGQWRDNFESVSSRGRESSPSLRGFSQGYKEKTEEAYRTRPDVSNVDLSMFLRGEREKVDEERSVTSLSEQEVIQHRERNSRFRHNELPRSPSPMRGSYGETVLDRRREVITQSESYDHYDRSDYPPEVPSMPSRDVDKELMRILEDSLAERGLSSAKRIDFVVRGVKDLLTHAGYRPSEIKEEVRTLVGRLIKAKKWTITYEEALQEGATANEPFRAEREIPFHCTFCKLKYSSEALRCKICNAEYLLRIDLDSHIFIDHQVPTDQIFDCPFCPESFHGNPKMFRDHIYMTHFCADDHLECPYGCKILVLQTMSSETHYQKYHFCNLCGDNIQNNMQYHKERFHRAELYPDEERGVHTARSRSAIPGDVEIRRKSPSPTQNPLMQTAQTSSLMQRTRSPNFTTHRKTPSPETRVPRYSSSATRVQRTIHNPDAKMQSLTSPTGRRRSRSPDSRTQRSRSPDDRRQRIAYPGTTANMPRSHSPDVRMGRQYNPDRRKSPSPDFLEDDCLVAQAKAVLKSIELPNDHNSKAQSRVPGKTDETLGSYKPKNVDYSRNQDNRSLEQHTSQFYDEVVAIDNPRGPQLPSGRKSRHETFLDARKDHMNDDVAVIDYPKRPVQDQRSTRSRILDEDVVEVNYPRRTTSASGTHERSKLTDRGGEKLDYATVENLAFRKDQSMLREKELLIANEQEKTVYPTRSQEHSDFSKRYSNYPELSKRSDDQTYCPEFPTPDTGYFEDSERYPDHIKYQQQQPSVATYRSYSETSTSKDTQYLASDRSSNLQKIYGSSAMKADNRDTRELFSCSGRTVEPKKLTTDELKWLECKECGLKTPDGGYVCSLCNEGIYMYRVQLNVHLRDMHGYRVPQAEMHCEICREDFSNSEEILLHVFSVAHVCASEHLKCHDPDCTILVFSEAEKLSHAKRFHKGAHKIPNLDERDPHFSFSLAPRSTSSSAQSILNISKTRDKFLKIPVGHDAAEGLTCETSAKRTLVRAGFMYCSRCPLMYHPALSTCGRCSLKFIFPQAVMEHMIKVHDVPEIYSQKRCPFCREILQSYTEFLNHLVTHFCREHSECEFGCTRLVIGGPKDVVKHVLADHSSDEKRIPVEGAAVELCTKPADNQSSKAVPNNPLDDLPKKLKCQFCFFEPTIEASHCDMCPQRDDFVYPTPGDVGIHKHLEHKAARSPEYQCGFCDKSRKFNGDGLNQHQAAGLHRFCSRGHFICLKCKKIWPQIMLSSHISKCAKVGNVDATEKPKVGGTEKENSNTLMEATVSTSAQKLVPLKTEKPKADDTEEEISTTLVKNKRSEVVKQDWKHCKFCPYSINYAVTFTCSMCDSLFYNETDCDYHLYIVHGDNSVLPLKCSCGYSTRNSGCWTDHRREEHNLCPEHFSCKNKACIWLFPSRNELLGHYQQNTCKFNSSRFTSMSVKNCDTCHNIVSTESCCICILCTPLQKSFPTVADYTSHLTLNHRRFLAGEFKCPSCPVTFSQPEKLRKHMTSVHAFCATGHALCSKNVDCSVLIVDSPVNVISHKCAFLNSDMSIKMLTLMKSKGCYKCINCNFGFEEITLLQCSQCPIVFLSREELAGHEKLDHNKYFTSAFPCSLCNCSFPGQPDKLLNHRKVVHQYCPFHKFEFGRMSCLHMSIETKALTNLLKSDARRFMCVTCHQDIRSSNKIAPPDQCPLCPFNPGFYSEDEFMHHMHKVHMKEIPKYEKKPCLVNGCKFIPRSLEEALTHRVKGHGMCSTHIVCPMFQCRRVVSSGEAYLTHAMSCTGTKPVIILDGLATLNGFESVYELVVRPFYNYSCQDCPFNVTTCLFIKCKLCEKVGEMKGEMNERPPASSLSFLLHLVQHHSFKKPQEVLTCPYCVYSTFSSTVTGLFLHMTKEHRICANHFLCYNSCLSVYNSLRKYRFSHYLKKKCDSYPEQMFENQQFSYTIKTSLDIVNRVLFNFNRSSVKFSDFSGMKKITDNSGKTTLRSIFTAAAGLLPSELLEETKLKLKQELTKDKKRQDKDGSKRSKTPSKKRKSRSRTPSRKARSRSRSRRRSPVRRSRSPRRRSRSRSRRRSRSRSRKRSVSRRKRSRSASRSRHSRLKRSRSRSVSKRRQSHSSRSISRPRKRSYSKSPRSKISRRERSTSSERKISRNVIDTNGKSPPRKSKSVKDKSKPESKKSEVKLISAADGIESKSLSTLINEYSEPHALQALASSYAKEASPEKENKENEAAVNDDTVGKDAEDSLSEPAQNASSSWEDVMTNMLNFTEELVGSNQQTDDQNDTTDEMGILLVSDAGKCPNVDEQNVNGNGEIDAVERSENDDREYDTVSDFVSLGGSQSENVELSEVAENWDDEFLLEENDEELEQKLVEENEDDYYEEPETPPPAEQELP